MNYTWSTLNCHMHTSPLDGTTVPPGLLLFFSPAEVINCENFKSCNRFTKSSPPNPFPCRCYRESHLAATYLHKPNTNSCFCKLMARDNQFSCAKILESQASTSSSRFPHVNNFPLLVQVTSSQSILALDFPNAEMHG